MSPPYFIFQYQKIDKFSPGISKESDKKYLKSWEEWVKFYGKLCHEERKPRKSVFDISNRILFNVFVRIVRVIMLKVVGKLFIILTILRFIVLTFDENLSYLNRGYIRNLIWAVVAFTMITLEVFFELFK